MSESASELHLGDVIRAYREARGLSRRALSLQAGLSESVVGKVEAGNEPSLWVFARLVRALRMTNAEVVLLVAMEARRRR